MGHYTKLLRLSQSQLPSFKNDRDKLFKTFFIESGEYGDNLISIDKAWEGIRHLLVGEPHTEQWQWEFIKMALGEVIASTENDEAALYFFLINFEQVKEIDLLLKPIDRANLQKRFNKHKMMELKIYPNIWASDPEAFEYVYHHFENLKHFYKIAASKSMAVISITT